MTAKSVLLAAGMCLMPGLAFAQANPVYIEKIDMPMAAAAHEVESVLHDGGYKIVLKLNILKLIGAQQKTLKIPHFNERHFSDIRAIVFCNPFDFSKLINSAWPVAAGCPLTLDIFSKGQTSYVVYGLRADYALTPQSRKIAEALDTSVIKVLQGIPMSRVEKDVPDIGKK
ncbi:MAG: DUF302 domain-containing protein [Acidithiobacillus sp.]|uniref:DUF302 domain-containing protein n=1 Tax=Acidithiobacillus sp. TaxID=1872118 RepID=UPI003CFEC1FD